MLVLGHVAGGYDLEREVWDLAVSEAVAGALARTTVPPALQDAGAEPAELVPLRPERARITYFAPTRRARRRL